VRALDTIRPKDDVTPQVVKWLLNHRKHGWYWDSTRDTARVIAAFANHMQVSGERKADYDLEILWDGAVKKRVHVDGKNMFTAAQDLVLEGAVLEGGKHTITVRRKGQGAVYMNAYLSFFTTEDDIKAEGLELKVDRRYYKLERADRTHEVAGARGQGVEVKEAAYRKVPLASGAKLESGDLVLVELKVTSKNDYEHLAFEDYKPAGLEAVALRSGSVGGEAVAHMELRDDRVVFFLSELTQGSLMLRYRLRAEVPGRFSAMPTIGFGMYAPELKANSDEWKVSVSEARP
jgi:alpha-2-macroglobulin